LNERLAVVRNGGKFIATADRSSKFSWLSRRESSQQQRCQK
jgi:hypothetical protein